jgi:hypothetical protein
MSKPFPEDVVRKALLWCDRHCCVCGRQCGLHIETHHIDPNGKADIDNCLPVCYECHGILSHYDPEQPRGCRFRPDELTARREQIYEQFTRNLVPHTHFEICEDNRGLPWARFRASHIGNGTPIASRRPHGVAPPASEGRRNVATGAGRRRRPEPVDPDRVAPPAPEGRRNRPA